MCIRDRTIFDYEIIPRHKGKNLPVSVMLVAFPQPIIEDYCNVFNESGFKPLAFEIEAHAFSRAIIPQGERSTKMVIDFGKTRTSFIIIKNAQVRFTSTINVAGESLSQALSQALSVSMTEAEAMKKKYNLAKAKANGTDEAFNALFSIITAIKKETEHHINFWNTHPDQYDGVHHGIEEVILCGGDSNLTGFPEYLSQELKLPVRFANPWINIASFEDYIPEIEFKDSLRFAAAIGLALRSFL